MKISNIHHSSDEVYFICPHQDCVQYVDIYDHANLFDRLYSMIADFATEPKADDEGYCVNWVPKRCKNGDEFKNQLLGMADIPPETIDCPECGKLLAVGFDWPDGVPEIYVVPCRSEADMKFLSAKRDGEFNDANQQRE